MCRNCMKYCGVECQRLNWKEHRIACRLAIEDRNRAEVTSLAAPLGDALVHDSFERWRLEIWNETRELFFGFFHIPEFHNDVPLVIIDFDFVRDATVLRLQWRPRPGPCTIIPFEELSPKIETRGMGPFRDASPPEVYWSPPRFVLCRNWYINSAGGQSSFTHTFVSFSCESPSLLEPLNQELDWLSAWWAFIQFKPLLGKDLSGVQVKLFGADHLRNTKWSALARTYWTSLEPKQRGYLREAYEEKSLTDKELYSLAYLRTYAWGSTRQRPDSYVEWSCIGDLAG
ncbi:hypothetical protein RQP46_002390 [Phenoliferia psychrophenolica]